ncbi:MAG: hypothetical protein OXH38_01580, partial [Chloroflexi bacterium]|nr:hypothetical protein [Chloroflexota bacterium]
MDYGVRDFRFSSTTTNKLGRRGIDAADVYEMRERGAVFIPQKQRFEIGDDGELRRRPRRLLMIGRNWAGQLLTIVLELPDSEGTCQVVTGFDAKSNEVT